MPFILHRVYSDKNREERVITEKINRWIIVRPGFLNNGNRTGRYRAMTDLDGVRGGKISRADVADFMLKQAIEPTFLRQTPTLLY